MRLLILAMALIYSSIAFSQSIIVLKTGKVLTLDEQGMIYDLNNFLLPYEIKNVGGRYIIDDKRKLRTVDRNGLFYSKEKEDKVAVNIEHFGDNYFISKFGTVHTIDEQGFVFKAEKEREFRHVKAAGGNFIVAEKKVESKKSLALFVVTNLGKILEVSSDELNGHTINYIGGQYFTTTNGELFTISTDGFLYSKKTMGIFNGWELKRGGNYFFNKGSLYTISQAGVLMSAGSVTDRGQIKYYGKNFFITVTDQLYTISASGSVRHTPFDYKASDISYFSQP